MGLSGGIRAMEHQVNWFDGCYCNDFFVIPLNRYEKSIFTKWHISKTEMMATTPTLLASHEVHLSIKNRERLKSLLKLSEKEV